MGKKIVPLGLKPTLTIEQRFVLKEFLVDMLDDLGLTHRAGDPAVVEEIWEEMLTNGPWRRKGRRWRKGWWRWRQQRRLRG